MKRILHVVGGLNRGGAETWLIQVLRGIDRGQFHFDFLVHSAGPFHYQAEAKDLGAKVLVCEGYGNPLLYGANLRHILRMHGPYDCLHSHVHHFSGIPMLIARMMKIPVRVAHSHLDTSMLDRDADLWRRSYVALMKRLIWSCCTAGTAVSTKAADALFPPRWSDDPKWKVILLGIDLEPFNLPSDRVALRRQLGIPAGATVVGHAGRFERQKNHAFLLEIAAECVRQSPETMFLLIGDGPLRPEIECQAHRMNLDRNIRFAGIRSDVPALMSGVMDVFLLPSLYEGLGIVLLEAQAAGLPSLISDQVPPEAEAIKELVGRESLAASPQRWAERLLFLSRSRRAPGPEALSDPWSIDRSIERMVHAYR